MVYYSPYDEELDREKDPSQVSLSGAAPTSNQEGVANTQGTQASNTGSGFQNLDKYLATNNAKAFGGEVLGKVKDQVTQAGQNQQQAANQFQTQVQSANQLPTETQVQSAIEKPAEADKKQFQTWQSQNYQGPNSLAESSGLYNQFWSGTNKANTQSNLLGTEAGRFSLLDTYFKRPDYNFGQKSLDNLLVQRSGLGEETQGLQNQAAQLKRQGTDQSRELQSVAGTRAGEVDQSRGQVRGAIGLDDQNRVIEGEGAGAIGQAYGQVNDQMSETNRLRAEQQARLTGAFGNLQFTPEQMQDLGLAPMETLYNLDLNNYYRPGDELNRNQVMTPEQRARIQALSELAGVTDTFASGQAIDATDPYSFDQDRFRNDLNSVGSQYNNEVGSYLQSMGFNPDLTPQQRDPSFWQSLIKADQQKLAAETDPNRAETWSNNIAFYNNILNGLNQVRTKYQVERQVGGPRNQTFVEPVVK